ncbi:cupin domain-containing protein [Moorella sp. Hama-1]|uniref:cupin domain-containing protein n=1 Tax=Moorella sp. Hama-1 TaxID=2138101 RepID=UPI000D64BCD1|nr:cupin domain-containing protein [Moorella sp. Hama-1]BCV22238.1 cupin [Moorella sp. Hama-1]
MEIIRIAEQPQQVTPRGVKARAVLDLPYINIMNLTLAPGDEVPSHTTPVDVLFHVIEGEGSITIGPETARVAAGDIVVSPAGIPHALEANTGTHFSVLVMKIPNPKKMAK